jgi:hypothetical protein
VTRQNPPRDERSLIRRFADLDRRLHALETGPRIGVWSDLTPYLVAGYSAAATGAYGAGYMPQYRFRLRTEIELRGTIQAGTGAGGTGANGFDNADSFINLPSGTWPLQTVHATVVGATGGGTASAGVFRIVISNAGVITYHNNVGSAPGWIALDGVRYSLT